MNSDRLKDILISGGLGAGIGAIGASITDSNPLVGAGIGAGVGGLSAGMLRKTFINRAIDHNLALDIPKSSIESALNTLRKDYPDVTHSKGPYFLHSGGDRMIIAGDTPGMMRDHTATSRALATGIGGVAGSVGALALKRPNGPVLTGEEKSASIMQVFKPTLFNTTVAAASGGLGALNSYNASKDKARTEMIEAQVQDLKGRKDGGDFNVIDKARLFTSEISLKMDKIQKGHPHLTAALNTLANAAVGYGTASMASGSLGSPIKAPGSVEKTAAVKEALLEYAVPIVGGVYGAARGLSEAESGNIPEALLRSLAGGVSGAAGSALGGTIGALGGVVGGGLLSSNVPEVPVGMAMDISGGLGTGIGGVIGARSLTGVAKNLMDKAYAEEEPKEVDVVPEELPEEVPEKTASLLNYVVPTLATAYGVARGVGESKSDAVSEQVLRGIAGGAGSLAGSVVGNTVGTPGGFLIGALPGALLKSEMAAGVGGALGSAVGAGLGTGVGSIQGANLSKALMDSAYANKKTAAPDYRTLTRPHYGEFAQGAENLVSPPASPESPPQEGDTKPSVMDKIKPWIKPALLAGGGFAAGVMGNKMWNGFRNGGEKLQTIASRALNVHPNEAIKAFGTQSDDVRAGWKVLSTHLSTHDLDKMSPAALNLHGASEESAMRHIKSVLRKTAEVDLAAIAPESLTLEQTLRPYYSGVGGMVAGGAAGKAVHPGVIAPIIGAAAGYLGGGAIGRATLPLEKQLALREFEQMKDAPVETPIPVAEPKIAEDQSFWDKYKFPIMGAGGLLAGGLYNKYGPNHAAEVIAKGAEQSAQKSPLVSNLISHKSEAPSSNAKELIQTLQDLGSSGTQEQIAALA